MKIDFHTHILPRLDDGAISSSMSLDMLQKLEEQQVDTVVLTPHYYSHQIPISEFTTKRQHAVDQLKCVLPRTDTKLYLGAEVYFSDYLFNNRDLSPLLIGGTRTMLLEFPYNRKIDDRLIDKVDRLIGEYGITPVIAHVERYPSLIRSKKQLEKLIRYGCVLQVNLSSFTSFGKGRLISLFNDGYFGALGTDAHNVTSRPPDYDSGYAFIKKKGSKAVLTEVQQTMFDLLNTRGF